MVTPLSQLPGVKWWLVSSTLAKLPTHSHQFFTILPLLVSLLTLCIPIPPEFNSFTVFSSSAFQLSAPRCQQHQHPKSHLTISSLCPLSTESEREVKSPHLEFKPFKIWPTSTLRTLFSTTLGTRLLLPNHFSLLSIPQTDLAQ